MYERTKLVNNVVVGIYENQADTAAIPKTDILGIILGVYPLILFQDFRGASIMTG